MILPSRYDDACGTAHALDLFGDRWALLILRELMLGPRRFSHLRADLPGMAASILTQRLSELEARGLLIRGKLPPPAATPVYALTPWGLEVEPITAAMGRWAARSPFHDASRRISGVSLLLSLRTMLDRERAAGIDAVIGFRFGDDVYRAQLTAQGLAIAQGAAADAVLRFSGTPAALGAAIYGGAPLSALEADGAIRIDGDRALAERFTTLFPLPDKISLKPQQ